MKLVLVFGLALFSGYALSFDHVITCPKAIRLGGSEKVYLDLHGYASGATVSAFLQDLPDKGNVITVMNRKALSREQAAEPIELPVSVQPHNFRNFRNVQKVQLTIQVAVPQGGGAFTKKLDILVAPQSGYLFVITNQPVYKPGDSVLIKAFTLNQTMQRDPTNIRIVVRTPDEIGTYSQIRSLRPDDNFVEDRFPLGPTPEFGVWSVQVSYALNGYETTGEAKFLVDRFVLPTFQVNVDLRQKFVYVGDKNILGTIKADYSYGLRVTGSVHVSMKVKLDRNTDHQLAKEFFTVPEPGVFTALIQNGRYSFNASVLVHLVTVLRNQNTTIQEVAENGGSFFVEATVTETGSGHTESTVSADIPIVPSRHIIDTTRTSFYYIPGQSFNLKADVLTTVGRNPVPGINYSITGGARQLSGTTSANGQINAAIDFRNSGALQSRNVVITVGNVVRRLTIEPYRSRNTGNPKYLTINAMEKVWDVGDNLQLTLRFNDNSISEIRYFVVARGTIVYAGVSFPERGTVERTQSFTVQQNMVPAARVVAYYLSGSGRSSEIVSASFWFDVTDQCKSRDLEIQLNSDEIQPGDAVNITLQGASRALVSVTAVDRAAYFLYGESRLTRDSMFNKMESYDQGCGRNGGRNGQHVFLEAGLTVATSQLVQQTVDTLNCTDDVHSRKKRQQESQTSTFAERVLDLCSKSAKLEGILGDENCTVRANRCREQVEFGTYCCDIFEKVCEEEATQRFINALIGNIGRSGVEFQPAVGSVRNIRKNFEQSLAFRNIRLNNNGQAQLPTPSQDSITTFEIDAASMEPNAADGFCVAKTKNLKIFRSIFVQVYAPFALKKREQTSLRLAVFNYGDEDVDVIVDVRPPSNTKLCTQFAPEQWTRLMRRTRVPSHSSISTTVTVLPLRVGNGETSIEFRVRLSNNIVVDLIKQPLRIEEVGEVMDFTGSEPIDLRNSNRQTFDLNFRFQEAYVDGSRKCWLYAYPNFMGPSIEVNPVNKEPRNIHTIFRMPGGCGEQTMITAGPNVYAHMYLEATGNLLPDTAAYEQSLARNRHGYNNELKYRSNLVNKRAWSVFVNWAPSTWLNAYVDKVFTKANMYDDTLDLKPVCSSLNWLLTQQANSGEFLERGRVIHREMHGAVGTSLSLTCYVVISMLETQSKCLGGLNQRISAAVENAVNYLIRNENSATFRTPYGASLFAYVLALHQPTSAVTRRAFTRLNSLRIRNEARKEIHWEGLNANQLGGTDIHAYWYQRKPLAVHIEATSYALLALIKREEANNPPTQSVLDDTRKIVMWLIRQRNDGGAFVTTQDTVIGLQALATYQMWTASVVPSQPTNITIGFTAVNTSWQNARPQFTGLTDANARIKREIEVPSDVINEQRSVTVTATGNGEGVVSYRCIYRTQLEEEPCQFNLTDQVQILNEKEFNNQEEPLKIKLTVTVQAIGNSTEMSIIEVGLMSGFIAVERSVTRLSLEEAVDGIIQRYEITDASVIFYLDKISHTKPLRLAFDMEQRITVNQPQPARIHVYDYYEPSIHCGVFYSLPGQRTKILTSNCGSNERDDQYCTCAEGGCVTCRTRNDLFDRTQCVDRNDGFETTLHCAVCKHADNCTAVRERACRSNYVYAVTITSVHDPLGDGNEFYSFKANINRVLKAGNVEGIEKDSTATFLIRSDCLERCRDDSIKVTDRNRDKISKVISEGETMLIMGRPAETSVNRNNEKIFRFRLDSEAMIERIIPDRRCQKLRERYEKKCRTDAQRRKPTCVERKRQINGCDNQDNLVKSLVQGCG